MKTQLTDLKLSTSIWQLLHQIDNLLGQSSPLSSQLQEVADVLTEALDVDAVWFLTVNPLPPLVCGVICTPLSIAPDAKVRLVDKAPPLANNWSTSGSLLGQVMAGNSPLFIEPNSTKNAQTDCDLGDVLFKIFDIIPLAIVPLASDSTLLGALAVGTRARAKTQFSPEVQDFLAYLGKHLAKNLQNSYLLEHTKRHGDTLLTLNQIAQTITSSLDIDDVIQNTMAGINRLLDVEAGSLLLVDEETDELYFKITLRGENKQVTSYRLKRNEGIAGWVVSNNRPSIVNNPAGDDRFSPKIDQAIGFETKRVLCAPLVVQGHPIGALELLNKRSGPFNKDDQELLISMAAALGVALKNATLYEESQERAHINEVINHITAVINAGHGLSETAKIIFKQFRRLFAFDHISISLLDDSKEKVRQWSFSEHGSIEHTSKSVPLNGSELAQIIQKGQGHIEHDISKSPAYPDNEILQVDNIKSKAVVPLIAQKTAYGSLTLGNRQAGSYSTRELKLLEQLTPQVAIAIDKALLIDAMEQRTNELQLLNRLGEMLATTTDTKLIVDTTLNMLPRLLPGDVQGLIIADEESAYAGVTVPFNFRKEKKVVTQIFNTFLEISETAPVEMASTNCIAGNMPVSADWAPVTELSLPILTRRGTQGIMYMASGKEENFGDDVLRIFSLIVSQISAIIENAHLFQQIEQERARLAAILASITDAVLVVNRNGRIVLDNPAARDVLSAQESQSGRLLAESTTLQTLIDLFDSAMQGGNPTGELVLNDGRTFFANLSPVSTGEIGVIGWVATLQDVSHFKELNQLKNDFVSSVSHDLRSPLSSILLAINLITETGQINNDQQELINLVDRQVRNMSNLIEDILDVGKIEADIDMEMEPCNLAPIIETVAADLRPQAAEKGIQLTSRLENDFPPVMANAMRMHQVIHNLVGNAIKYTPGQGNVTIKAFSQDDEMRVQVIDTGLGIPASDQPHIFEKFYRVRGDHVADIKGTGLGLAITKGIVEKHQGRIWLESVFGQGSTFTVALPIYNQRNHA